MSISQLFQPNGYDLHCNTISAASGGGSTSTNIVIGNSQTEIEFPVGTVTTNVLPSSITPRSGSSKIRVQLFCSVFLNIGAGDLLIFWIERVVGGATTEICRFEFGTGNQNNPYGQPLTSDFIDEPGTTQPVTYQYRVESLNGSGSSTPPPSYISFFNRTSTRADRDSLIGNLFFAY
eukprot:Lithocolla_globosa_v1_NODE_3820_length_1571_cov_171.914248.p1 type:complete len:177 gc:universal NODE_3820_length_1571_cov_171.914248:1560-1030(-)